MSADKLSITGLLNMGNIGFYNNPADPTPPSTLPDLTNVATLFGGVVVNVTWAQLQSSEGGTIAADNPIDQAIAAVNDFNNANGTYVGIKLRVWGGFTAPEFAKNIDGPPITLVSKGETETIGRFWTSDYIDAWTTFQTELAAEYDSNPLIREVAITSGAAATDEPFVPLTSYTALQAAGYNDTAEQRVLLGAVEDYAGWTQTPLDYTFNPFHEVEGTKSGSDTAFTLAVMQQALNSTHQTYLSNHALQNPLAPSVAFVYYQMLADEALQPNQTRTDFQTASPKVLKNFKNWASAVAQGVTYGAHSVELWPSPNGFVGQPASFVGSLADILAAGPAPATPPPDGSALALIAPSAITAYSGPDIALSGYGAILLTGTHSAASDFSVVVTSESGLGTLSANDAYNNVTGDGSSSITITGALAEVNTALASLTEILPSGVTSDTLTISAADTPGHTAARSLGVTIATVGPATANITGPQVVAQPGTAVAAPITLTDANAVLAGSELSVTVTTANGGLLLMQGAAAAQSGTGSISLSGSVSQVAAALLTLAYIDTGASADTIDVTVTSDGVVSHGSVIVSATGSLGVATTDTWTAGGTNSLFETPANWRSLEVPGTLDTAVFASDTHDVSGSGAVGELQVLGVVNDSGGLLAVGLVGQPGVDIDGGGRLALLGEASLATTTLVVGDTGSGVLHASSQTAADPTQLATASAVIGNNVSGAGTMLLDGVDWTDSGTVMVGASGSGALTIDDQSDVAIGSTAAGTGDLDIGAAVGGSGLVMIDGANTDVGIAGNLAIGGTASGAGGTGTLIALLAPLAQNTSTLTIGGSLDVWGAGALRLTGSLAARAIDIAGGGLVSGDGTLGAGSAILNDGTIEAAADSNLGITGLDLAAAAIGGTGTLLIDAGATLTVAGSVASTETIEFAANTAAQFSTAPYPAGSLILDDPQQMQGTIVDFSFADSLVLRNFPPSSTNNSVTVTYNNQILSVVEQFQTIDQGQIINQDQTINLSVMGDLNHEEPIATVTGTTTRIQFVAKGAGQKPTVVAPSALHAVAGSMVPVIDVTLLTPQPATPPSDTTVVVSVTSEGGTLAAGNDCGNVIVGQPNATTLLLAGSLNAVEQSLQTLQYQGATAGGDTLTITVSDYAGTSTAATIDVTNSTAATYTWAADTNGSFGDGADWILTVGDAPAGRSAGAPPGGADTATFGAGNEAVTGDGAVGQLQVNGTVTLSGNVQTDGSAGAVVDDGGALILANGAVLTTSTTLVVGQAGAGTLAMLDGSVVAADMVVGAATGSNGAVIASTSFQVSRDLVVGAAGAGTMRLDDSSGAAFDNNATLGQWARGIGSAIISGGFWSSAGTLTVGDRGTADLRIEADANGRSGQATDSVAILGNAANSSGQVTVDQGLWLTTGTLTIGAGGRGILIVQGGAVSVGTLATSTIDSGVGTVAIGGAGGGSGLVEIGGGGALTASGNISVGSSGGAGVLQVGLSQGDSGLVSVTGTLTIGANGVVLVDSTTTTAALASVTATASAFDVLAGGRLSGSGIVGGPGNGSGAYLLAAIDNAGTITASGGRLLLYGDVQGTRGTLEIDGGATLELQGAATASQTVTFSGREAEITLDDPAGLAATIQGFTVSDTIDLPGFEADSASWNDGTLTVSGGPQSLTLLLAGAYSADQFVVVSDQHGGALVEIPCFARGTHIDTPRGDVAVEDLRAGDVVMTASHGAQIVEWIGERLVDCRRHPRPGNVWPVRVRAGAFGNDLPRRDLLLSPDHSLFIDGVLIPVRHLMDGAVVVQERRDRVHYFHVELPRHDVLLAEGLPAESYLDTGNRHAFANGAAQMRLHPEFGPLSWHDDACAPLCTRGPKLAAAKRRLRAESLRRGDRMADAADLHVRMGDRRIRAAAIKGKLHRFLLPRGAREVQLVSRSGVPAKIDVRSNDRRRLGVRIDAILLAGRPVPLDSAELGEGFHPIERNGNERWRWTDGAACLRLPRKPGSVDGVVLELLVPDVRHWGECYRQLWQAA